MKDMRDCARHQACFPIIMLPVPWAVGRCSAKVQTAADIIMKRVAVNGWGHERAASGICDISQQTGPGDHEAQHAGS